MVLLRIYVLTAHAGDQTQSIWISRSNGVLDRTSERRGLPFTLVKTGLKFWGLP